MAKKRPCRICQKWFKVDVRADGSSGVRWGLARGVGVPIEFVVLGP